MDIKKSVESIKLNVSLIKAEGVSGDFEIELAFLERFPDLYEKFPFLVKKIISGENLEMLDKMLSSIDNISKGKDKFEEEVKLGKILEKKYIQKDSDKSP